jgi:hypothetical protein
MKNCTDNGNRVKAAVKAAGGKGMSEYGGREKYSSAKQKMKHEGKESKSMERKEKMGYM